MGKVWIRIFGKVRGTGKKWTRIFESIERNGKETRFIYEGIGEGMRLWECPIPRFLQPWVKLQEKNKALKQQLHDIDVSFARKNLHNTILLLAFTL